MTAGYGVELFLTPHESRQPAVFCSAGEQRPIEGSKRPALTGFVFSALIGVVRLSTKRVGSMPASRPAMRSLLTRIAPFDCSVSQDDVNHLNLHGLGLCAQCVNYLVWFAVSYRDSQAGGRSHGLETHAMQRMIRRRSGRCQSDWMSGRSNQNTEPGSFSGSESSPIRPRCPSTIARAMLRPRPVPFSWWCSSCTCANFSKIRW